MADNHSTNFVRILREIAAELKLEIRDFSSDWGFRLSNGKKHFFVVGYQFPLNNSTAKEICQDKALASEILTSAGVPNVTHVFLPSPEVAGFVDPVDPEKIAAEILEVCPYVVVKDNYGTGGHRVMRAGTVEEFGSALREIQMRSRAACAAPYYEIREEYRIVMLCGRPMLTIRKERAFVTGDGTRTVDELIPEEIRESSYIRLLSPEFRTRVPEAGEKVRLNWKHNLGQGAEGVEVTDRALLRKLHALAKKAAEAVGAEFLSVDIIDDGDGLRVLELNGGVMMEHFSGQSPACYKKAKSIYKKAVRLLLEDAGAEDRK